MDVPPIVTPPPLPEPESPEPIARLTFPLYVRVLALVTVGVFLYGLVKAPKAIQAGIEAERAHRDLTAGHYGKAIGELDAVLKAYPDSKDARLDHAEACGRNGDFAKLANDLEWFQGKEVTKEENERLEALVKEAESQLAVNEDASEGGK